MPIIAQSLVHVAGSVIGRHRHGHGQLAVVTAGTMTVLTEAGWWLAPPGRGIWVPSETDHSACYSESSALIQLLMDPALTSSICGQCRAIAVSPLLRELADEAVRLGTGLAGEEADMIARLVVCQMARSGDGPVLFVPHGRDRRLRRVIDRLRLDPGLDLSLDQLAKAAGSSPRTMARLFVAETGLTFGQWREHLRAVAAVDRLTRGASITQTALDLGYQSPSSFTTMFTRLLGLSPGRYMKQMGERAVPLR